MLDTVFLTGNTQPTTSFLLEDQWRQEPGKRQAEYWFDDSHAPIGNKPIGGRNAPSNVLNGLVVVRMDDAQPVPLPDGCLQYQVLWRKSRLFIRLLKWNALGLVTKKRGSLIALLRSR